MKKDRVLNNLQNEFKRLFKDEFDDPNECFLDFMLDLISKDTLFKIIKKENYYHHKMIKDYIKQ